MRSPSPRVRRAAVAVTGVAGLAALALSAPASAQPAPVAQSGGVERLCSVPDSPHEMACMALRRTGIHADLASGYGPSDLRSAYDLPANGGAGQTIAIVDAYDDPSAASDLATYRQGEGLPALTGGQFRKVNQNGQASPLPQGNTGWAGEISLDLDMVSAIAPKADILLVEASSANGQDLYTAIDTAVSMGAKFVSNSWGGSESSSQTRIDSQYLDHPGVVITASTGDSGHGAEFPATSRYVTAVGGTSLSRGGGARGWTESAWSGAGSGCSSYDAKPSWQNVNTGCSRRAEADVSAVADPATGVAVYNTYGGSGWAVYGGTSAAAPIIASVYALAGTPGANDYPASYPYAHTDQLNDPASGSNGSCGSPMCRSGIGWDGPTGLGTPNGTGAFTSGGGTPPTGEVRVDNPGDQSNTVGDGVDLQLSASGGTAPYTWQASGLPDGLSMSDSGHVTGSVTTEGTYSVRVTATDSAGKSGSASFGWSVTSGGGGSCPPAWDSAAGYAPGDQVSYQGNVYKATWWSVGATPGAPGSWAVWDKTGTC